MTKKQVGEEMFIHLTLAHNCSSLKEVSTGTQASQEARADAEAMEGCPLLAFFPWLALVLNTFLLRKLHCTAFSGKCI